MSDIENLLREKSADLRDQVYGGSHSWGQIKSAAVAELTEKGIQDAEALLDQLAKEAGFESTSSSVGSFSVDVAEICDVIEKAASYIGELEAKIETSENEIASLQDQLEKVANESVQDIVEQLVAKGFSEDEASQLTQLPSGTLHKVASMSGEYDSFELGKGSGLAQSSLDPFTAFLTSDD